MNIQDYIAKLEAQRDKIDAAIAAFRALQPTATPKPVRRKPTRTAKRRTVRGGRYPAALLAYLSPSFSTPTATIVDDLPAFANLNGPRHLRDAAVRNALSRMRDRGLVAGDVKQGWRLTAAHEGASA